MRRTTTRRFTRLFFRPKPLVHVQEPLGVATRRDNLPKLLYMLHRNGPGIIRPHTQSKVEITFPQLDGIRDILPVVEEGDFDSRVVRYYPLLVKQDVQSLLASKIIVRNGAVAKVGDGIDTMTLYEAESASLVNDPAKVHDWG